MHSQVTQMLESFLKMPAFSRSKLIKILLKHSEKINFSKKENFIDGLLDYYQRKDDIQVDIDFNFEQNKASSPGENPAEHDYRIKSIRASNFRGIPDQIDGVPFGIDFCIEDVPRSTIILGTNGSGKTSIFSGMEMIYTQKISEKIFRSKDSASEQDFKAYYERIPKENEPQFDICSMEKTFTLNRPPNHDNDDNKRSLDNYFISENDLITIGKLDFHSDNNGPDSFTSYIARSLGFSEIVEFNEFIMIANNYKRSKESNEFERLQRQQEDLEEDIINLQEEVAIKNEELASLIENNDQTLTDQNKFSEYLISLKSVKVPFNIDKNKVIPAVRKYTDARLMLANKDNITMHKEMLDFLSLGMKLIDSGENCPFCRDSKKSNLVIKKDVQGYMAQIENHYKLIADLVAARNEIIYLWENIDRSLKDLIKMLTTEMENLIFQEKLIDLYKDEKSLLYQITTYLLDTEFWGLIKELIHPSFRGDKDSRINEILSKEKESDLYDFIKRISEFIQNREKLLDEVSNGIEDFSRGTILQKESLNKEIDFLTKQLERSNDELNNKKVEIGRAEIKVNTIKEIKEDLRNFLSGMSKYLEEVIDEPFKKIEPIVLEVMRDYLLTSDSKVKLKIEKLQKIETKEDARIEVFYYSALLEIEEGNDKIPVTPDKYFNSFRYSLFCLMLKVAITISYRAQNKQNFPLIVDDIFSSSDYENRNKFAKFVKKVIELFDKYSKDLPLQLIIFTHDSLIFRSTMDAIYKMGSPYISQTKFGRLFVPEDKDENVSFDCDGNKFWNLVLFINDNSVVKAGTR